MKISYMRNSPLLNKTIEQRVPVESIELKNDAGIVSITFFCKSSKDKEWFKICDSQASIYYSLKGAVPTSVFLTLELPTEEPYSMFNTDYQSYSLKMSRTSFPLNWVDKLIYEPTFLGIKENLTGETITGIEGTPDEILWICQLMMRLVTLKSRTEVYDLELGSKTAS